jgi:O-antigen/teichoic acid export membrane protein
LLRFITVAGNSVRKLVSSFYGIACVAGVVFSVPFVILVTQHVGSLQRVFGRAALMGVVFCVAVVAWSIFALQDMVLTGLRRAHWVLLENQMFNLVKIVLLVLFATLAPGTGIFASWLIPLPVALLAINLLIFRRFLPRGEVRRRPPSAVNRRSIATFMRIDYIAVMLSLSTAYLMPLLVVAKLGAKENAYFFVSWSVALALDGIVLSFATSLTVEGAAHEQRLAEMAGATLRRVYMFVLPVVFVLGVLAPFALALFGHQYASQSTTLLRLLAFSMLVRPVTSLVLATSRVKRRM